MLKRCTLVLVILSLAVPMKADEGMWLFNSLPKERLEKQYQFKPTDAWAKSLQLSSVRFSSGGSGSFVSSNGLVLTNHHVASDTLFKLSTPNRNLIDDGFLAKSLAEELPAPDLELNQLVEIQDVTKQVQAAVKDGMSADDAAKARRAVMGEIESESLKSTGLRSDVVTLYGGAQYHLYRYKKYTDVRLVWAPETKTAFFGGDADNFEYPRYCLDLTIFRVYEDGKPAQLKNFLPFSTESLQAGQLVFVSGHPGRTQRAFTLSALQFLRDARVPYALETLRRKEIMLQQYSLGGPEQTRRARDDMFGVQNSRKAYTGMLSGLQDPKFFEDKAAQEKQLLEAVRKNAKLAPLAKAWDEVAELQEEKRKILHSMETFRSRPYEIAETLYYIAMEDKKPSAERLREYRDSNRESLLQELLSPAPVYADLEQAKLADDLARFAEVRGGDDPLVLKVFAGKNPSERAAELILATKLAAVDARQALLDGKADAVIKSDDPMIALVKLMEPEYRKMRALRENLEERERQAYAKITEATVAVKGTDTYPDATFTLRLAFGVVKGYEEDKRPVAPWTTLGGLYDYAKSHEGQADYVPASSWAKARDRLDAAVPFNFVSTADIIGGNSGSPVVDREGRLVGVIFDGNIQSLTSDYMFSETQARAVSVTSAALIQALKHVYDAAPLADQLGR